MLGFFTSTSLSKDKKSLILNLEPKFDHDYKTNNMKNEKKFVKTKLCDSKMTNFSLAF